jgi:hypothetical protein
MKSQEFAKHIRGIRETAGIVDAALQDLREATKVNKPIGLRRVFHEEAIQQLEGQLDEVLRHPKGLKPEQLAALGTVVFATPAHPNAKDFEVDRFKVMEPMTGAMESIKKMGGGNEKMVLLMTGFAQPRVQGTKSEYKPVMLDRNKL